METLALVGQWNVVTVDQHAALEDLVSTLSPSRVVLVVTGLDVPRSKRRPFTLPERLSLAARVGTTLGRPYEVVHLADRPDGWAEALSDLLPAGAAVVSGNPQVRSLLADAGLPVVPFEEQGVLTVDVVHAIASRRPWEGLVPAYCREHLLAGDLPRLVAGAFADVRLAEGELTTGRDFELYARGMDAGLALKLSDMLPHVRPGVVVDKGCGTGSLLEELSRVLPGSELYGVDLSRELLRMAEGKHYEHQNVTFLKGNVIDSQFPAGTVDTVVLSSVVHEVYSYTGYDLDQVRAALVSARSELRTGGRVVIRDGIRPVDRPVVLSLDPETMTRFERFSRDFKPGSAAPGVRYAPGPLVDGWASIRLSLHDANEFLSKKDYLENWDSEVQEEFGTFTLDEWSAELSAAGFEPLEVRSYVNPWILANRYVGRARLNVDLGGPVDSCVGAALPFPDTTCVVVGEVR